MDGMDSAGLKNSKLDAGLREVLFAGTEDKIGVIVQTPDGLKDEDRKLVKSLGGTVKDDLYIIKAYSADLSPKAINMMILSDRVVHIFHDADVKSRG